MRDRISRTNNELGSQSSSYSANVDEALEEFYQDAIRSAASSPTAKRSKISEGYIREWCEKELITPSETRGTAYQGDKFTEGLQNGVVKSI